jgi:hypothetical protein
MCRHLLGALERAAVGEVGGDPGGTKRVAADFRRDAGSRGAFTKDAARSSSANRT